MRKAVTSFKTLLCLCAFPLPLWAQDQGLSFGEGELTDEELAEIDILAIADVTVTAQKREEGLQSVPLTVTPITREQLDRLNIHEMRLIDRLTPSLFWGGNAVQSFPTSRGAYTAIVSNTGDPSLGFHVDGVYRSRLGQTAVPLVDLERVEVLAGPQGTLFGRNSTAGAVNVISALPTDSLELGAEVTVGNYNRVEAEGYFSAPITDRIGVRLAVYNETHDGFVDNVGPAPDLRDEDVFFGRFTTEFDVTDRLNVVARISGFRRIDVAQPTVNEENFGQPYELGVGNTVDGQQVPFNSGANDGVDDFVDGVNVGDIGVPSLIEPYVVAQDFPASTNVGSLDADVRVVYDVTDSIEFTSITAYTDYSTDPIQDGDFSDRTSLANDTIVFTENAETFIQEAQLAFSDLGRFEGVVGVFFMDDRTEEEFTVNSIGQPGPVPNRQGEITTALFDRFREVNTQSIAGFGQVSVDLAYDISFTGGVRYTRDKKEFIQREFGWLGTFGQNPRIDDEETFSQVTWRAGLEYAASPTNFLYTSVSTGFRSGGFNGFFVPGTDTVAEFDNENVRQIELGSKNSFFDERVRLNAAAYYASFTDQQITQFLGEGDNTVLGVGNAGESRSFGVELTAQARPVRGLNLYGILSYTNAEFEEYSRPGLQDDPPLLDLSGNRIERTPRWRTSLIASYDWDLGDYGTLRPLASFAYVSRTFQSEFNAPIFDTDSYTTTDLRLAYLTPDDRWLLEVFVENLEDEAVLGAAGFGGGPQGNSNASFFPPRFYGARLSLNL